MYPYGLIGNCQTSALVNQNGSIDWLCLPRPDSPPVFGKILDAEGGYFSIESSGDGNSRFRQEYISNTNVLTTYVTNADGSEFKITDFCPRFYQHERMYRPISLFRIVEPVKGSPSIRVVCHPVNGWDKQRVRPIRGNSHLTYEINGEPLRLTTNMPLTYLCEETSFHLKETLYFGLTCGAAIQEDLEQVAQRFLHSTLDYWRTWVKHCSIPTLYQRETIRSALILKLHCYEDTGAILAALTTSLPEEVGHTRNWDYRFCWLRDTYFVLTAFHNLGHFEEMEGFVKFLLGIAEQYEDSLERLRPVYRLDRTLPLPETVHPNWSGHQNSRPVRSDNQAAEHVQNDVYGEMVLSFAPIFMDQRFEHLRTPAHERLLENLGKLCSTNVAQPDAGLWEIRDGWREHSFSNLMCWAGLDRIKRIRQMGYLKKMPFDLEKSLKDAEASVRNAVKDGAIRNGPADDTFDSSLLLASVLRFPDKALNASTVSRIHQELRLSNEPLGSSYLYRYLREDDFGRPQSAFMICSFWLVQALAKTGQMDEARRVMESVVPAANELGLFSEHYYPNLKVQTGNFPQAYSHVGLINAAFSISPDWSAYL